jgi:exodeoxyribonuclease VII large subunit
VPVISGVGHETDWTLADLVADLRAPTPSAAAEVSTPSVIDLALRVYEARLALHQLASGIMADHRSELQHRQTRLGHASPRRAVLRSRESVRQLVDRARRGQRQNVELVRGGVILQSTLLRSLNPVHVLGRGYAAVSIAATGQPVTSRRQIPNGDVLHLQLADGAVLSRVESRAALNHLAAESAP